MEKYPREKGGEGGAQQTEPKTQLSYQTNERGKLKVTVIDLSKVEDWPHPTHERGKLNETLRDIAMVGSWPHFTHERGKLNDTVIDLAKVEYRPHPTNVRGKLKVTGKETLPWLSPSHTLPMR